MRNPDVASHRLTTVRLLLCSSLILLLASCTGGDQGSTPTSAPDGVEVAGPATSATPEGLSDEELAKVLALAVPAAIKANPDGPGEIVAGFEYHIGDALGSVDGSYVTFPDGGTPLSADVQAAVLAAVPDGSVSFSPVDLAEGMLLLGMPTVLGDSITLTFEQRCGGDPNALCGSGGAFVLAKVDGEWQIVSGGNAWIS